MAVWVHLQGEDGARFGRVGIDVPDEMLLDMDHTPTMLEKIIEEYPNAAEISIKIQADGHPTIGKHYTEHVFQKREQQ